MVAGLSKSWTSSGGSGGASVVNRHYRHLLVAADTASGTITLNPAPYDSDSVVMKITTYPDMNVVDDFTVAGNQVTLGQDVKDALNDVNSIVTHAHFYYDVEV